jgi:hypothetical protein
VLRVPRLGTCQIFEERTRVIEGVVAKSYHAVYEPNLMIQPLGTTPLTVFMQVKIKKRLRMWVRAKKNKKQCSLGDGKRYVIRDQHDRKKTKAKEKEQ